MYKLAVLTVEFACMYIVTISLILNRLELDLAGVYSSWWVLLTKSPFARLFTPSVKQASRHYTYAYRTNDALPLMLMCLCPKQYMLLFKTTHISSIELLSLKEVLSAYGCQSRAIFRWCFPFSMSVNSHDRACLRKLQVF